MTRRLLLLVCAVLCLGSNVRISAQSTSSTTQSAESNFVEGVVRVKLQREIADRMIAAKLPLSVKGTNKKYVQTGVTPLDRVNQKVKAVSMTRVFPMPVRMRLSTRQQDWIFGMMSIMRHQV